MRAKYPPKDIDHLDVSATWKKTIRALGSTYSDTSLIDRFTDLKSMARQGRSGLENRIYKALSRADEILFPAFRSKFGYGGLMMALSAAIHDLSMVHPSIAIVYGDDTAKEFSDYVTEPIMEVYDMMKRWSKEVEEYGEFVAEEIRARQTSFKGRTTAKKLRSIFANAVFSGDWKIERGEDIVDAMERRGEMRARKLIVNALSGHGVGARTADAAYARYFEEHVSFVFG